MEKKEITRKLKEILSKHEEHTSEGGIYWEYEWVGGKAIPDGMGGYEQIGGEKVSAEEAFYKEMADFISSELDKAREEGELRILEGATVQAKGLRIRSVYRNGYKYTLDIKKEKVSKLNKEE
jgi:hypothetical protein